MFIRQVVLAMMLVSLAAHSSARANPPGTGKAQTIAATSPAMNLNDKADQDALMAIANDFMVAWQKQDMSTISDILAPYFLFAGPHGVVPKATTLKALSHCALGTFTLEDFQMRRTSSDSAVLIYKIHRISSVAVRRIWRTLSTPTPSFVEMGSGLLSSRQREPFRVTKDWQGEP